MSEAIIAKKAEQVEAVAEKMKAAASIVVVDSRGLTVEQDTVLRRKLRESGVEFKVIKNSILTRAAEKAGIRAGDVITGIDGTSITSMDELNNIKNQHQIGDEITLKINRNGKEMDMKVTLQEQPSANN